jgi:hypothetical protein
MSKRTRYYDKTQKLIEQILVILETTPGAISTRQAYYALVSVGAIPATASGYDRIQRLLVQLRRSGAIHPERICDRTRSKIVRSSWSGLDSLLESAQIQYRRDYWADQPTAVMVAVEKAALEGFFTEVCDDFGVPLYVSRGYPSYSFLYDWAEEIKLLRDEGKRVKVYFFGDFDPSGIDIYENVAGQIFEFISPELSREVRMILSDACKQIVRDVGDDTEEEVEISFAEMMSYKTGIVFKRLGLLPEDLDTFKLYTLPVKRSDSRSKKFIEKHGTKAAELDALPPVELQRRIREAIESNIDTERWQRVEKVEQQERLSLERFIEGIEV